MLDIVRNLSPDTHISWVAIIVSGGRFEEGEKVEGKTWNLCDRGREIGPIGVIR